MTVNVATHPPENHNTHFLFVVESDYNSTRKLSAHAFVFSFSAHSDDICILRLSKVKNAHSIRTSYHQTLLYDT